MYADLKRNLKRQKIKSFYDNNVKKNPKDFDALQEEYYKTIKEKNLDYKLCDYVWKVLISMSKGSKKFQAPLYSDIY